MGKKRDLTSFAKKKISDRDNKPKNVTCVIYTRVSSAQQQKGLSLETQKEETEKYCKKRKYSIIAYYGNTYESAKSDDDRKEFSRMLDEIVVMNPKPNKIIVYSTDRFSRTGSNAIAEIDRLEKNQIVLESVLEPVEDPYSSSGRYSQGMNLLRARFDNDQRKEKCTGGIIAHAKLGYWMWRAPYGYENIRDGIVRPTEGAEHVKSIFNWRKEGKSLTDIQKKLKAIGVTMSVQTIQKVLKNVFYCGYISSSIIEGLVRGIHKAIISEDLFLEVNNLKKRAFAEQDNDEHLPLKRFVRCKCGSHLTGYPRKKGKNTWYYYKDRGKGHSMNARNLVLHDKFHELLNRYTLKSDLIEKFKFALMDIFNQMEKRNTDSKHSLQMQLADTEKKIAFISRRYALEELPKEVFDQVYNELKEQKEITLSELEKIKEISSNLSDFIEQAINICKNLSTLWEKGSFEVKQGIQKVVFPQGLIWDNDTQKFEPESCNLIFQKIAEFNEIGALFGVEKNTGNSHDDESSPNIALRGIEPRFDG
jgi:DNA invertase Pin-like site-specific DNA recombinase